jgi:O-antigen ligase
MENIFNFSKNVFQNLKQEYNNHASLLFVLLALLCIPLGYAFNSLSLALLIIITLINFKKADFSFKNYLIFPIVLYLLMLLSLTWSIDTDRTIAAILKELPLLLFPICFLLFRTFSDDEKQKIIKGFSYGMVAFAVFYLINASIRFLSSQDTSVFFYHELVTKDVNAIHVSVYMSVSFFYFLVKPIKTNWDKLALAVLFLMVFLLSSKNIVVVFIGLLGYYYLFFSKTAKKLRLRNLILAIVILLSLPFIGKVKERFKQEYETIMTDSSVNDVINKGSETVYNVSIKQAWNNDTFKPNDFFPGTAFRVYQFRIFTEFLQEEAIFWKGFGLDASYSKIEEKGVQYHLFLGNQYQEGYQKMNFHNQYIQVFAELGIFGFLLLIIMLALTIRNGIASKNYFHIAFSVLMIFLFITESFLWRQRGVTFFIVMYCVLNTKIKTEKTIAI